MLYDQPGNNKEFLHFFKFLLNWKRWHVVFAVHYNFQILLVLFSSERTSWNINKNFSQLKHPAIARDIYIYIHRYMWFQKKSLNYHLYADDTQLYISDVMYNSKTLWCDVFYPKLSVGQKTSKPIYNVTKIYYQWNVRSFKWIPAIRGHCKITSRREGDGQNVMDRDRGGGGGHDKRDVTLFKKLL